MLRENVRFLICPHCGAALRAADDALCCANRHSFDIARQGYVSLLGGKGRSIPGDTAAMVNARAAFLEAGHFAPVAEEVARTGVRELSRLGERRGDRCVVDIGAGTGYYLGRLAAAMTRAGPATRADPSLPYGLIAVDVSKHAMRRAARLHPELAAVVGDVRRTIPLTGGSAGLLIDAFAPREPGEIDRVLAPEGSLLVVIPRRDHLAELIDALGLLTIDSGKRERTEGKLSPALELVDEQHVSYGMRVTREDLHNLVSMGPSAWHRAPGDTADRIRELPETCSVTASVTILTYRRRESMST